MTTMNLTDTIILFVGFYFLVSTAMMKVHGRVNRMLVGRKYDLRKARDLPGFMTAMFLPNIVIGVITMAAGVLHYIASDILRNMQTGIYVYIVYLAIFAVYAVILVRAQKRYLSPLGTP